MPIDRHLFDAAINGRLTRAELQTVIEILLQDAGTTSRRVILSELIDRYGLGGADADRRVRLRPDTPGVDGDWLEQSSPIAERTLRHLAILTFGSVGSPLLTWDLAQDRIDSLELGVDLENERYRGRLLALIIDDEFSFPWFQFASADAMDVVLEANFTLGAREDPWGALAWWLTPNERIGPAGYSPAYVIAQPSLRQSRAVKEAAQAAVEVAG